MRDGERAEDDEEPLASRVAGMGGGGVLAATEAAAECRDRRAWRMVKRVCMRAVRRWTSQDLLGCSGLGDLPLPRLSWLQE